tara:strand:+ start:229 stop:750 length:522 start_codon:yes stop_codon:yes gene_type:complete
MSPVAIYLNTTGENSNFHTIILKNKFVNRTYIMALGYAGGKVYEEFFGQFITNDEGVDIGKVSNSIGPTNWENSVKISFEETSEGVCQIDELSEELTGIDQKISDKMFSKLEEFILYGPEAEKIQSDFPVLKEDSLSNLSSEIDGIFTDEEWDEDYMYITQESFWPLSLRFND